jgi:hypothetical protein
MLERLTLNMLHKFVVYLSFTGFYGSRREDLKYKPLDWKTMSTSSLEERQPYVYLGKYLLSFLFCYQLP